MEFIELNCLYKCIKKISSKQPRFYVYKFFINSCKNLVNPLLHRYAGPARCFLHWTVIALKINTAVSVFWWSLQNILEQVRFLTPWYDCFWICQLKWNTVTLSIKNLTGKRTFTVRPWHAYIYVFWALFAFCRFLLTHGCFQKVVLSSLNSPLDFR